MRFFGLVAGRWSLVGDSMQNHGLLPHDFVWTLDGINGFRVKNEVF